MNTYTRTVIALHWLIALLIFVAFGLGLTMTEMTFSPQKLKFFSWHKWIGVTVFMLAAWRLLWRLRYPAPALPSHMPAWEQYAAHATHYLLYLLFFVIPITGWLFGSAKGIQTVYLGIVPLPDLLTKDIGNIVLMGSPDAEHPFNVAELLRVIHQYLSYFMGALVGVHSAAAIKHYFVDRDEVMTQMVPALKPLAVKTPSVENKETQ